MIKLTNQFGSLVGPLPTTDASWSDDDAAVRRIVAGIKNSLGVLDPADLELIESTLQRYVGGGDTTQTGVTTPTGDALLARRLAEIEHNGEIADGYRKFWDAKTSEFSAAVRR